MKRHRLVKPSMPGIISKHSYYVIMAFGTGQLLSAAFPVIMTEVLAFYRHLLPVPCKEQAVFR